MELPLILVPHEMTCIAGSPVELSVTTVGRIGGRLEPQRGDGKCPRLRRSSGCKIENWLKYQLMWLLNFYYQCKVMRLGL